MRRSDCGSLVVAILALPLLAVQPGRSDGRTDAQGSRERAASSSSPTTDRKAAPRCPAKELLLDYDDERRGHVREVPIWQFRDRDAYYFTSGMTIDADGAPNAYNPDNTGLDDLANAGSPGHWVGILQDHQGHPLVQGPGDPFPGYYISCTSLADGRKPRGDPRRFVDATKIPYIVLPGDLARKTGARLGDLAVVTNLRNGDYSYAIFADVGTLGEGSIALANHLQISSDAREGGTWWGVLYLVFPGSGDLRPKTVHEIDQQSERLLSDWGGVAQLNECAKEVPRPPRRGFPPVGSERQPPSR